jgi:hypothetical protein
MDTHVRVLAVLQIALGAFGVIGALIVTIVFGGAAGIVGLAASQEPDAWVAIPLIGLLGGAIVLALLLHAIPSVVAGIGLLRLSSWARVLALVMSVLNLLHFPLGTVVGAYGLWVLLSPGTERLFVARPPAAP